MRNLFIVTPFNINKTLLLKLELDNMIVICVKWLRSPGFLTKI